MNSQKFSNVMQFQVLVFIHLLYFSNGEAITGLIDNMSIHNISQALVSIINTENNNRIHELKEKLANITKYVINKEDLNNLLNNVTKETKLNETNFYKALKGEDHFRFLTDEKPKSLYLKLKEKITRDDVMTILSKKGAANDIVKASRKAMGEDYFEKNEQEIINDVVDRMIAEVPNDVHNYKATINDSKYWDPQNELEDLHEFHQHDGRRIYKGERTTIRYYPFIASIHVMGRFWCGGVIYWNDIILTSASCLQLMHNNRYFRENPKVLEVRIGSNHSRIGGEVIEAMEVYFHPAYNPKTLSNNIAVIRLFRQIHFSHHRIPKIIDISHNEGTLPDTAEVLLLGWGVTKISQKMSYEPIFLQRKFLPVYPNKFCKEIYGDKFITSSMFCAGTMTTGEGACDHDAGGPAIMSGKLVGIISFGPSICGFPNAPTVFTLVGAFADWIETINETMPSYYRGRKRTTSTTPSALLDLLENWPSDRPSVSNLGMFTPMAEPTYVTMARLGTTKEAVMKLKTKKSKDNKEDSNEGWSLGDGDINPVE